MSNEGGRRIVNNMVYVAYTFRFLWREHRKLKKEILKVPIVFISILILNKAFEQIYNVLK